MIIAYAGSKKTPPLLTLLRAWAGLEVPPAALMTPRERFDFSIITLIFGVLTAVSVPLYHYISSLYSSSNVTE